MWLVCGSRHTASCVKVMKVTNARVPHLDCVGWAEGEGRKITWTIFRPCAGAKGGAADKKAKKKK